VLAEAAETQVSRFIPKAKAGMVHAVPRGLGSTIRPRGAEQIAAKETVGLEGGGRKKKVCQLLSLAAKMAPLR